MPRWLVVSVMFVLSCLLVWLVEKSYGQPAAQFDAGKTAQKQSGRDKYVSNETCLGCHKAELSYLSTAHHKTSQASDGHTILGSFKSDGSDVLMISDPAKAEIDPGLYFKMEKQGDRYYQTAVMGWPNQIRKRTESIDIVIGSGKRGQSYLFWQGDLLFELPVSFWTEGQRWINSPGYKNGTANFARPITPRCMECHASFIQQATSELSSNKYQKDSLALGIDCETCHGPGKDHVALHTSRHPPTGSNEAIVNPAKLARDRQVDICALCHNGNQAAQKLPAFSFTPGQPLDRYLQPGLAGETDHPDVHGNQVGLLKRSRCYLSSPTLGCSTCHDVHAQEHEAAWYSRRCMTCHQPENCGMSKTLGDKIVDGCVNCHMKVEPTTAFNFDTAGAPVKATMRNHWIGIPALSATDK
jgi:hypothetical protein